MRIVDHAGAATPADAASPGRRILVVGVGDDGPAGLTSGVLDRIAGADVLVGGRRHLGLFTHASAERLVIADGLDGVLARIEAAARDGRRVVVLASGDPCFFGIGPHLASRLGSERVEIVPAVSSVALAFARLGVAWQDAQVISAHGRPLGDAVAAARGAAKLAVLTDDANTPAVVADALLQAGAADADAWVFEHLGGRRERRTAARLSVLRGLTFAALNVLVIPGLGWPSAGNPRPRAAVGRHERDFQHTAGLITKPEVRAVALSKLCLPRDGVLWDVGAGSGSVAIEAADLIDGLTAYAVERANEQLGHLRRNIADFGLTGRIRIVAGEAPAILADLPDPDAVFVGGSGGHLAEILALAAARVTPGGRIVVSLVTFEHIASVAGFARDAGLAAEVVQINVARGADILGLTRLQAENPVTLVTLSR